MIENQKFIINKFIFNDQKLVRSLNDESNKKLIS